MRSKEGNKNNRHSGKLKIAHVFHRGSGVSGSRPLTHQRGRKPQAGKRKKNTTKLEHTCNPTAPRRECVPCNLRPWVKSTALSSMARGSQMQSALNTLTPSETRPLGFSGAPDRGQGTDLAKQTLHDSGATLRIAGTTGQLPLVSVILEPTQAYRTDMEERRREASCTHSLREVMIRRKAWKGPHRPTVCAGKGQGTLDPSRDQGKGLPCLQNTQSSSQGYGEWGREGPQAAARPARILVLPLQRCDRGQVSFRLYASISLNKKEATEAI